MHEPQEENKCGRLLLDKALARGRRTTRDFPEEVGAKEHRKDIGAGQDEGSHLEMERLLRESVSASECSENHDRVGLREA